ncbi:MAG: TlpA family protein disulfide reductase [Hyphomicrobium sp.]|nr:TlpA family protein disulfide reductase [Hyphomicrobium sp.]
MSTDNKGSNGLMIFAIAALMGFAGSYYFTQSRPDNAPSAPARVEKAAQDAAQARSEPKTGQMAAFVTKKTPEALPDIAFNDASGKQIKLSDFKGRAVLLNLWATWCAPCREEMPSLDRLQVALGSDKFEVVALSIDRQGVEASKKFLDEVKAKALKLYVDATAKQGTALKIVGMPTTILIGKDGLEIGRLAGPAEWDSEDAKKLIDAAAK